MYAFLLGLSYVFVSVLGAGSFGSRFKLITTFTYNSKITAFTIVVFSILFMYLSIFSFWKNQQNKSSYILLFISSLMASGSVLWVMNWLFSVQDLTLQNFLSISFPTDVDEIIKNIRLSLVESAMLMFAVLGLSALSTLIIGIIHFVKYRSFE